METETIVVKVEGQTLSQLLARHYLKVFPGAVAQVYALNQNLARAGSLLPVGASITVPTLSALHARMPASSPVTDVFTL